MSRVLSNDAPEPEINFNRHFYQYTPPSPLDEIETDLKRIESEITDMRAEVTQ